MKTIFPRAVITGSVAATLLFPPLLGAATYEVDTAVAASNKRWSTPTTWVGAPDDYPSSSADDVLAPGRSGSYVLLLDQPEIEIGTFTATGSGNTRRIRASTGQTASLTIGTILKSGNADLTIENGDGTLSVEIGTLELAANSNIEVGRGGISAFEVTGSSSISGLFAFNGGVASGESRAKLGALQLNGTLLVTGRESNGGVVEVRSLTGTSGRVQLTNSTHNPNPALNPKTGTLEINFTPLSPGDPTTADYGGVIEMGQLEQNTLAVHKKGEGVQIFSRSNGNWYNGGTLIEGGVLAVTNTSGSGLGVGEVEVRNGGTLAGSGRIALANEAVVVRSGGVIAPGAHLSTGVATLTLSGAASGSEPILSLESGGTFRFRLGAEETSDSIAFTDYQAGGFQISGTATVDLLNVSAGTYTLFSFDAIDAGEIATLTSSLTLGDGLNGYDGTLGHDATTIYVTVQAIPEPTTTAFLLLGAGVGALSWWRTRRK